MRITAILTMTAVTGAGWSDDDLFQMIKTPLPFTELDVELIYLGIAVRSHAARAD